MVILIVVGIAIFEVAIIVLAAIINHRLYWSSRKKAPKWRLTTAERKGLAGEKAVAKVLGDNIENVQYVINNVLFETDNGDSCQIDHVFINRYGIWVIETKNKIGKIYGYSAQRHWEQYMPNGQKFNFENPIRQNEAHIIKLSRALQADSRIFHNVVVFLNDADISKISAEEVYPLRRLNEIKSKRTDIRLTDKQMLKYYSAINELINACTVTMQQHIDNVREKQRRLAEGCCPRCGKPLILKEGEYGKFYGCSGYPQCRFRISEQEMSEL